MLATPLTESHLDDFAKWSLHPPPARQNPELEFAQVFKVGKVIIFLSYKMKERKRKKRNVLSRAESLIELNNREEFVLMVEMQELESRKAHLKMTTSIHVLGAV